MKTFLPLLALPLMVLPFLVSCTTECGKDEQGRQMVQGEYGTCVPANRTELKKR